MEIHKPKPWRGWREFLREYLIIFVGVLTALAFEQGIEWLHRRAEVSHAREALRSEVAANAGAAQFSLELERCQGALADRYDAWARGGPRPPATRGYPFAAPFTNNWEVVKAGAAAHMPLEERLAYAQFYDRAERVRDNDNLEIPVLLRVGGQSAKAALTPADAGRLLEDLAQARVLATVHSFNSRRMIQAAKAMGVDPNPMTALQREGMTDLCNLVGITPNLEPGADLQRTSRARWRLELWPWLPLGLVLVAATSAATWLIALRFHRR